VSVLSGPHPSRRLTQANDHAGAGSFLKSAMRMGFYNGCENNVSLYERHIVEGSGNFLLSSL
jgi:hypothetical protein